MVDFAKIPYGTDAFEAPRLDSWNRRVTGAYRVWDTPEKIAVKPLYTAEDLEGLEHVDYLAGLPPYLRGPYASMYTQRPLSLIHI